MANLSIKDSYQELKRKAKEAWEKSQKLRAIHIQVGSATCEEAAGAKTITEEFFRHIKASGRKDIHIRYVGCTGRCSLEPVVTVFMEGTPPISYGKVSRDAVHDIFMEHIIGGVPVKKFLLEEDGAFSSMQERITLRHCGQIDPKSIFEYIDQGGFSSFASILERGDPDYVIREVSTSKLRGRGGAGFPTGKKWEFAAQSPEKERFFICNADEGDPGAFMDRSMLESDPFSVIEGMMIGGFAIRARRGFFYIRAEYPFAVERIEQAIASCRNHGLLGKNILGSSFSFDLEVRLGAGAFVCGEETALIHSIEGERGQPRIRPPFPPQKGLWSKPTVINNVETLANLPYIFSSKEKFLQIGTEKSGGTKVFAVSGKVLRTGLVEVPIGTPLRKIIFDICGGIPNGKQFKAVQTGGPAGGCIPASLIDIPVDYEPLVQAGSMMGSGGMIVLDEDDCMVHMAKFFMTFNQEESCGKCSPCREGTLRMLEILERITSGTGTMHDLEKLERLALLLQKASLCGLGRGAPNPVLSTLKYFRNEYEEHVKEKHCPARRCQGLIHYEIDPEKCVGCTLCARNCPVSCIKGERRGVHEIDQIRCIKCGRCFEVCRFSAVKRM